MNKLTLKQIAEMSDEEVYKLSIPRPGHPEQRGFMLSPKSFESEEEMPVCIAVLAKRLHKITENK